VLKLLEKPRLPTLANNCYIVGQARRADVVWSEGDFLALCEHMLNGNPLTHFLTAWTDKKTEQPRFAKAKRCRADKRASWAWASITEKANVRTAVGFYPSNPEGKSRWAAIDFDAHNGERDQARKWSLEAFSLLLEHPQLYLVLCASGNGYHLFIFARDLYPIGNWIVLLKQVCEWIGASIADGVCETFPNERAESQRVGKAIRAPGTLNPKTGKASLIEAETIKPLLETLPRTWSSGIGKVTTLPLGKSNALSLQGSTSYYFLTTYSVSTKPIVEALLACYPIESKGTRNNVLMELLGDLIHKFGREAAERIITEHYRRYEKNIRSSIGEHIRAFGTAWDLMRQKVVGSLLPAEERIFNALASEHQREGFLIARAFAGAAKHKGQNDFEISRSSLADRLSITPPGAADVIRKLCEAKTIDPTQPPSGINQQRDFAGCSHE
jgi:TOTE conflict system, Archaeo-Eukaryotic Primase domain